MNEIIKISNNLPQNFEKLAINIQTNVNEKVIFDVFLVTYLFGNPTIISTNTHLDRITTL